MQDGHSTIVVDTNVLVYLVLDTPQAAQFRPHLNDRLALISFQSLAELYLIACRRNWGERRRQLLQQGLDSMVVVPGDENAASLFAALTCEQTSRGRMISVADAWVATTAILTNSPIVTNDHNFDNIAALTILHAIDG
jgi:predicted nucleic acid-binding protein